LSQSAKLHALEKSKFLRPLCESGLVRSYSAAGGLPEKVGEAALSERGPKGRFYEAKSFIGRLEHSSSPSIGENDA